MGDNPKVADVNAGNGGSGKEPTKEKDMEAAVAMETERRLSETKEQDDAEKERADAKAEKVATKRVVVATEVAGEIVSDPNCDTLARLRKGKSTPEPMLDLAMGLVAMRSRSPTHERREQIILVLTAMKLLLDAWIRDGKGGPENAGNLFRVLVDDTGAIDWIVDLYRDRHDVIEVRKLCQAIVKYHNEWTDTVAQLEMERNLRGGTRRW